MSGKEKDEFFGERRGDDQEVGLEDDALGTCSVHHRRCSAKTDHVGDAELCLSYEWQSGGR